MVKLITVLNILAFSIITHAQEQKSCKTEFNELTRSIVQQGALAQEEFLESLRKYMNGNYSRSEWSAPGVPSHLSQKFYEFFEKCLIRN